MCPRHAQIPAVTDVRLDGKSGLVMLILPFFFWGQPGATAGSSENRSSHGASPRMTSRLIMHCVFVWDAFFLSVEAKWYIIKQNTNIMKKNTKSTEIAPISSKSWSRQQRIITWYLFGRSAKNYVCFWRGMGFCQTQVTGHQAEVLW